MKLTKKNKNRRKRTAKMLKNKSKKGGLFNTLKSSKIMPSLQTIQEEDSYKERSSFDNEKIIQLRRLINELSNNVPRFNLNKQISEAELEDAQNEYNEGISNNALRNEMLRLNKNLDYATNKLILNIKNIEQNNKDLEKYKRELEYLEGNGYRGGRRRRKKRYTRFTKK